MSLDPDQNSQISCDDKLTREEFLRRAAKAALTGSVVAAGAKVLDKFLVPPAYARGSVKMSYSHSTDKDNPVADRFGLM